MKVLFVFALVVCYAAAVGQWEEIDTDDEKAQELAREVAKDLSDKFKSRNHHKLVDVIRVRKQVVAGLKYEVKLTLRETSCKKAEKTFEEANECDFKDGSFLKYCKVTLWDKAWEENKRTFLHYSCSSRPFE
nr:cystatin family protein [Acinetobacter baumannii]KAB1090255.1 hypothetical protein F6W77_19645 [Acinetobacter baumannii]